MKPLFSLAIASVFSVCGLQATASPADSAALLSEPDVVLISAKIENAIAELPDSRTHETIQNAAFFILAKQDAALEIKVAAIDSVIDHAKSLGDDQVVEALNSIELVNDETVEASEAVKAKTVRDPVKTASFRAPPSSASKGGSDY